LTVSITTFTATDTVRVAGYRVTESATAPAASATVWSATAPTSYPFTTAGSKTLYAWAKDSVGNVSNSLNAQVTITLENTPTPSDTSTSDSVGLFGYDNLDWKMVQTVEDELNLPNLMLIERNFDLSQRFYSSIKS